MSRRGRLTPRVVHAGSPSRLRYTETGKLVDKITGKEVPTKPLREFLARRTTPPDPKEFTCALCCHTMDSHVMKDGKRRCVVNRLGSDGGGHCACPLGGWAGQVPLADRDVITYVEVESGRHRCLLCWLDVFHCLCSPDVVRKQDMIVRAAKCPTPKPAEPATPLPYHARTYREIWKPVLRREAVRHTILNIDTRLKMIVVVVGVAGGAVGQWLAGWIF